MNKQTLKPCPFCGHEDIGIRGIQDDNDHGVVWCSNCHLEMFVNIEDIPGEIEKLSTDILTERWNKRDEKT